MNSYLKTLGNNWNKLASANPMSSILVDNSISNKKWSEEVFFSTGFFEVQDLISTMHHNHIECKKDRALDFGCGIGRLTQALANEFTEVVGVDIAPQMIETAIKLSKLKNCSFKLNISADLRIFESNTFDFIYSNIVLQHIRPTYIFKFIKEMFRIIDNDGLIAFQLPDRLVNPVLELFNNSISKIFLNKLYLLLQLKKDQPIEMYSIRKSKIEDFLCEIGGRIVHIEENRNAGPRWISYTYYVRKSY